MIRPRLINGFEVKWCVELPTVPGTDVMDIDGAKYASACFVDKKAAMAFAKTVLPKDCFGAVLVSEFEMRQFEPGVPAWYRAYVSDPYEVSD